MSEPYDGAAVRCAEGESTGEEEAGRTQNAPRDCGGCSVCCTAMRVTALEKPAGRRCEHQTPAGCGRYEDRPAACRDWFCMWVRDGRGLFSDAERPDRLGVFFTATRAGPGTGRQTIHAHETRPAAAAEPAARRRIAFLRRFAPVEVVPCRTDPQPTPRPSHGRRLG